MESGPSHLNDETSASLRTSEKLSIRWPPAAGEKIYYFPSIAEPLNFFCAASNPKTADAYLGTGLGQHSRPPTLPFPQNEKPRYGTTTYILRMPARVEQPTACKMRPRSGALVAQPSYPLLVLNNYSADSNKLTVHRKHA